MQMGVCLRHPVIMLYLCPMAAIHGLIQRAVFKLVRCSSFSPILLSQMTQCGASGIAARSIGHCSALHRPLQCAAFFGVLSCTARGTPPSSLFQKTENNNAARWDTPHSIVCLTLLPCTHGPLRPMRGRRISVPIYSRPHRLSQRHPFRFPENCLGRLHPCFCPTLWSKAFSRDETWADGMSPARP